MKHTLSTDEIKEQAALYALGALSQHEARAFEVHLDGGCQVCELELNQFDQVVGLLGLEVQAVAPPPNLKQALLGRIAQEPKLASRERSRILDNLPKLESSAPGRRSSIIPWAIAACLALLALGSVIQWRMSKAGLEHNIAREQAKLEEQREIIGALASPGSAAIALAGQKEHPEATATVYWDKRDNRWVVAADLPAAPAGKQYQLWFINGAGPQSAGILNTDADGHGFSVVGLPPNATGIAAAAITLEPQGGSQKPTMPIYVLGKTG